MSIDKLDYAVSRFEIQDLASDYCHGFDKHDVERYLSVFWEDSVLETEVFGTFEGLAGITKGLKEVFRPAWKVSVHFTTNQRVKFSANDSADGICDVYCIGTTSDGKAQAIAAVFYDNYERRAGVWKIRKRRVVRSI